MEPVERGQPFAVFIDYAHTDAALDAALRSVREMVDVEKVAVVFGCGGDRDAGKRPLMGKVAGELADLVIATSDNPRSEDPLAILAAVEEGLKAERQPALPAGAGPPRGHSRSHSRGHRRRAGLGRDGGGQGARKRADRGGPETAVLRPGGDRQGFGGALWLGCQSLRRQRRSAAG